MYIYVGNLPIDMTREDLLREFTVFGVVIYASVTNDEYIGSGRSRVYGYVEMTSESEGQEAINNLEGKMLKGHIITVVKALPLSNKRVLGSNRRNNIRVIPKRGKPQNTSLVIRK